MKGSKPQKGGGVGGWLGDQSTWIVDTRHPIASVSTNILEHRETIMVGERGEGWKVARVECAQCLGLKASMIEFDTVQ